MKNRAGAHCSYVPRVLCALICFGFASTATADYVVQVGVYTEVAYAQQAVNALHGAGFPAIGQRFTSVTGREMIRVLVGPFSALREASAALDRLRSQGRRGIVRDFEDLAGKAIALPPPPIPMPEAAETAPGNPPVSVDALFALEQVPVEPRIDGFFQSELAYTTPSPSHLSKARQTLELGGSGRWSSWAKWRVSARFAYDAVFDLNDYYPEAVRDDQRTEVSVRETYVDLSSGDWDFRLGRQNIIWGEMIGLFFADVVSAKDLREFVLPDFDYLRIPQWAVRAEYFNGDFHGELVWIPYQTYDNIGVPGAEFYPYPPRPPAGYGYVIDPERRPNHSLENSGYGARMSYLHSGWDVSGFYYRSVDALPYFSRKIAASPVPTYVYTPEHDKIQQLGGTLSKVFNTTVMRAEVVYTKGRWFNVDDVAVADGVVRQNELDAVIGFDYPLPRESRLNIQAFARWYPDYDPALYQERIEPGASVYASAQFAAGHVEPSLLYIIGLNRHDWLASPKVTWYFGDHWKVVAGVDVFGGANSGLFGQYYDKDRLNAEVRYVF